MHIRRALAITDLGLYISDFATQHYERATADEERVLHVD